jgi:hypothetical protein
MQTEILKRFIRFSSNRFIFRFYLKIFRQRIAAKAEE